MAAETTERAGGRAKVLAAVRGALAPLAERAAYPQWEPADTVCRAHPDFGTLWELFAWRLKGVNGTPLVGAAALAAHFRGGQHTFGYLDPALEPALGPALRAAGVEYSTVFERARVDDYRFGVTRAAGAIAETGTVILDDAGTSARLAALAPWVHAAVLAPADLLPDVPTALARLGSDPCTIWCTGPSKTADVEGILIEGVHGPGLQIVCLL